MIVDISHTIQAAAENKGDWSERKLEEMLAQIGRMDREAHVDWDRGAGECWALIKKRGEVLGLLHAGVPLGIFIEGIGDAVAEQFGRRGVIVLRVGGYDERNYWVSREAMMAAFPYSPLSNAWTEEVISVHDLWFDTVT